MYKLTGKIQHYTWGGQEFIPQLLHVENIHQQPFAEYWMGAHPNGSAEISLAEKNNIPLHAFIHENTEKLLGKSVAKKYNDLPYLFKVLDVKEMLSIQVHPSKAEAEKGYSRENEAGIPLSAPHRNYKDKNHKPEMMLALSEFWLLHGFKRKELLQDTLRQTEGLERLLPVFEKDGYYGLYKTVMELAQTDVDRILQPILQKSIPLYQSNQLSKTTPSYWACKTIGTENQNPVHIDRGIFSIYFFNIVHLHPGQAIYQGAGVPHAYLEGQNIELMANSDNVLRGGLTPKHIDVPELLKHTLFEGVSPKVIAEEKKGLETVYPCPAEEFVLSRINIIKGSDYNYTAFSAEIVLLTEGAANLSGAEETLPLKKGEAALIIAGEDYCISTSSNAELYKAAVPEF